MKCRYCGSPSLPVTNCRNCGGPADDRADGIPYSVLYGWKVMEYQARIEVYKARMEQFNASR